MVLCLKSILKICSGWVRCVPACTTSAAARCTNVDWSVLSSEWKNFLLAGSPFLLYLFVFKYYAFLREYTGMDLITKPNTEILPYLEETIFRCQPHRKLAAYANPLFDLLAAVPYLVHFPLPVLFGVYLYAVPLRRKQFYSFMWCAGWVNFLAVIVQFVFPTAPPWFKDSAVYNDHGHIVWVGVNEAGFERLDKLFNMKLFHTIYSASPVKFGAMPSLHVAWPTIILVCRPWFSDTVGVLHVVWIAWAALYSNHHYGVDAMAGIFLVFFVNYCMTRIYCPFPHASPATLTSPGSSSSGGSGRGDEGILPTVTPGSLSGSVNALLRARPNSQSMPVIAQT